jgi:hypothetical protein
MTFNKIKTMVNNPNVGYLLMVTSTGVLITLFTPSTFWLLFANIYLILLICFYSRIVRCNKIIQVTIGFWLLSLVLYLLTFFVTIDETYADMVVFATRRFVFLLVFMLTVVAGQDLPAVQIFQADYATFNEGPEKKSDFLAFIRKHNILIMFLSFICFSLAISVFVTDPLLSTFFGILAAGFAALYLGQSIVYLIAFWKKPLDKSSSISSKNSSKKKNDPRGQTRTMFSGMAGQMAGTPGARKAVVTCVECAKGLGILLSGGEMMYKLSGGGMNAMSPPRQWMLNQMFPDDRTKIWTESKAGIAMHNRAMGNPHDAIYKVQDTWQKHQSVLDQIKADVSKKD